MLRVGSARGGGINYENVQDNALDGKIRLHFPSEK
jgi:hypothetical protein